MLKARVSRAFKRRLQEVADAQGKTSSEAMRQALVEWMSRVQQAA
ncbi:ribbon-helix-helix protein, CopG family [Stenotrophomonas maltophilia]